MNQTVSCRQNRTVRRDTQSRSARNAAGVFLALFLGLASGALGQSITSFSPKYAQPGEPVTIVGSGFALSGIVVKFNGLQGSAVVTAADGSVIQATVPNGATSGLISVQNPGGSPTFSVDSFTVIGPGPYIASFSPTNGGSGTPIEIFGAHFAGVTAVKFNGTNASFQPPTQDTLCKATAPNSVTTGPITVVTSKGTWTTTDFFYGPPSISSFQPFRGRTGTNVVIKGKNFTGAKTLTFNGIPAVNFNVMNSTQMVATVPTNASTGIITITGPGAAFPTSTNFVVEPTVYSFSPNAGPVGTPVTISGANLKVYSTNPVVLFSGSSTPAIVSNAAFGTLVAAVPTGATTGPITITNADGKIITGDLFYLPIGNLAFTPTNGTAGITVTITGQNLTGATNVSFNGAPALFTVGSNTSITATVPEGVSSGPIAVSTPAGTVTTTAAFYAPPVITSFSPTHGLPGTNVTIVGTNFLGASMVLFNGLKSPQIKVETNGTITAKVPDQAQTGPITVIAPAGTNTSAGIFTLDYTSDLALTVTALPEPVTIGSNLVYSLQVVNLGPFPSPGIQLISLLPTSVHVQSTSTSQGTVVTNETGVVATLGSLDIGGMATVAIQVTPTKTGTITNTASVTGANPDPVLANNEVETRNTVLPLPLLSIEKLSRTRLEVSWPVMLTNFVLETRPSPFSTNTWSKVKEEPAISETKRSVIQTNLGESGIYRLKK